MTTVSTDPALASADLLGQLAPPLRMSGGPDFILVKRAPGPTPVAGATLWLQNPTNAPMEVKAWLSFEGAQGVPDRFVGTLGPLEVGVLAVPVSITFKLQLGLKFTLTGARRRQESERPQRVTWTVRPPRKGSSSAWPASHFPE